MGVVGGFFFVFSLAFDLKVWWKLGAYCRHVGWECEFRVSLICGPGSWLDKEGACLAMRER